MNNKMALNTYVSIIQSKKQTKQTRRRKDRITETESILWLSDGREVWADGCRGEEIKKYKLVVMGM